MKSQGIFRLMGVIAALHVVVVSIVFGLRHIGYTLTATLSAILIWGLLFFLNAVKGRAGPITAVVFGAAVQQVAYQVWKAELPGFWWPLAQFGALHFLVAYWIRRTVP